MYIMKVMASRKLTTLLLGKEQTLVFITNPRLSRGHRLYRNKAWITHLFNDVKMGWFVILCVYLYTQPILHVPSRLIDNQLKQESATRTASWINILFMNVKHLQVYSGSQIPK